MRPTTYREQPACANCKHCEERHYYDSPHNWLCHQDGEVEPSSEIPEGWWDKPGNPYMLGPDGMWHDAHKVNPHGICDHYRKKKLDDET